MKYLAIILIVLGLALYITRVAIYGIDCGLLSVAFGDLPMDWTRSAMDFAWGCLIGMGGGMLYMLRR